MLRHLPHRFWCVAAAALALALSARADIGVTVNGADIAAGSGKGWTFASTNLTLSGAGPYVISGSNGTNAVTIVAAADCTVVALNLTVDVSAFSGVTAFDCGTNAVTLALWSDTGKTNTFKSGMCRAGIRVASNATACASLTVTNLNAAAALAVIGGSGAAGIGGSNGGESCGRVIIRGGALTVQGGQYAAGIGGGDGGAGGTVRVSGGTVFAQGTIGSDIGNGARATGGANIFTGGSICLANGSVSRTPSNGTEAVLCCTLTGLVANAAVTFTGLDGYGTGGIVADANGKVYLWLPKKTVSFTANGRTFSCKPNTVMATTGVHGAISPSKTVALWSDESQTYVFTPDQFYRVADVKTNGVSVGAVASLTVSDLTADLTISATFDAIPLGVTINGTDIANGFGTGWTYSDSTNLVLSGAGPFVISGNNIRGTTTHIVSIQAQADCTVVASNLVIDLNGTGHDSIPYITGVSAFDCGTNAVTLALWSDTVQANTFKSGFNCAGIRTTGGSLAITNRNGSAAVSAVGGKYGAGIGGVNGGAGGTVTIFGGTVTATGGDGGAGIGGGVDGVGGTVRVSGGTITATGGDGGAGIGGVNSGAGGTVTISGGTVTATGGYRGAGIGGGDDGGTVTISDGTVTATGGEYGAGIGGGIGGGIDGGAGGTVAISGGTVTAVGGKYGAGIGGGAGGAGGMVTVSGGRVRAFAGVYDLLSGKGASGVGGGAGGAGGTVRVSGGTVTATGIAGGTDIGGGANAAGGVNTFTGGSIFLANGSVSLSPSNGTEHVWRVTFTNATSAAALADIAAGLAALSPAYGVNGITNLDGRVFAWLPNGTYVFDIGGEPWQTTVQDGEATVIRVTPIGVTVDGKDLVWRFGTGWTYSDSTNLVLSGVGPFVISGNNIRGTTTHIVSIQAQADCTVVASNLVIDLNGTGHDSIPYITGVPAFDCGTNVVTLALWSDTGQANTFKSGCNCAGIRTTDGSLAVTNLNESAALLATGGYQGAGIGGAEEGAGGTVEISGGTVTATGGSYGAGIGGGGYNYGGGGAGGTVTISGGTVTATGTSGGADIGNGMRAIGGVNTFTGGSIFLANGSVSLSPSNGTAVVYCCPLAGFAANEAVTFTGLDNYGTNGIVADAGGNIYLWLPRKKVSFTANGRTLSYESHTVTAAAGANGAIAPSGTVTLWPGESQTYAFMPDQFYRVADVKTNGVSVGAVASLTVSDLTADLTITATFEFVGAGVAVNGVDIGMGPGAGWTFAGTNLTLSGAGPFVISGANTVPVSIVAAADCTVVASNLTVDVSVFSGVTAFDCGGHAVTLALEGTNACASGGNCAGIRTTDGSLAVTNRSGSAALSAVGGSSGAGIGGSTWETGGTVAMAGGILAVQGGQFAAGLGGGLGGAGGTVRITGGTVVAAGGSNGADIGGGYLGAGGAVAISGGSVFLPNGLIANAPVNAAGTNVTLAVFQVSVTSNMTSLADIAATLAACGYGTNGLALLNADGTATGTPDRVFAWLPTGEFSGVRQFCTVVRGAGSIVSSVTFSDYDADGVDRNGHPFVDFAVNGVNLRESGGPGWVYDWAGGTLSLTNAGPFVVSGSNGTNRVSIAAAADCAVVASNLTVDVSAFSSTAAFDCGTNAVSLALWSGAGTTNVFKSGSSRAGIRVASNATACASLAITALNADAALAVTGGSSGAGIGGDYGKSQGEHCGKVTIAGGQISVVSGVYGAGIGGGDGSGGSNNGGKGGDVTITGGRLTVRVVAQGDSGGAAIGGGDGGNGGTVRIPGGTVSVDGDQGQDIGYGKRGSGGTAVFTGGSILAASGTQYVSPSPVNAAGARVWCVTLTGWTAGARVELAGFGDYGANDIYADASGKIYLWLAPGTWLGTAGGKAFKIVVSSSGSVTMSSCALFGITVNGADISAGSGGGWTFAKTNLTLSGAGSYVISGSNGTNAVSIVAAADCAVAASNLTVNAATFNGVAAFDCGTNTVALSLAGTNAFTSGSWQPGLHVPPGAALEITGAAVASLAVTGGQEAAGIGGKSGHYFTETKNNLTNWGEDCGTVRIRGGILAVQGGRYAAGIGGGDGGDVKLNGGAGGTVEISGGRVTALAGADGGAGIGGGDGGAGGTVTISGGTVAAKGQGGADIGNGARATGGVNLFTGGSVCLAGGSVSLAPSNGTARVWCVTNGGFIANARAVVSGLPATYGTTDLYADASGKVYLWLPAGDYIAGGTSAAGTTTNAVLNGFGISATGAVTGPTNAVLTITTYDAATGAMTYSPEVLPDTALTTIYSTNLVDWTETIPANTNTLFMKLKLK